MARKPADMLKVAEKVERFIAKYMSENSAAGLVIGLSGGLDSSVVLKLAVNALGANRVHGLVMPGSATPDQDTHDAIELAKILGVRYEVINIDQIVDSFTQGLPGNDRAKGNLSARIRMCLLYYFAAIDNYLVAGTSDKSEKIIGFYTKYGDGAADMMPIADLYKTQVRRLAPSLKVPEAIIEKKSSPRLWKDHLAEEEIGLSYDKLDPILHQLVDRKKTPKEVAKKLGASLNDVQMVKEMMAKTEHKRKPAPYPKLSIPLS